MHFQRKGAPIRLVEWIVYFGQPIAVAVLVVVGHIKTEFLIGVLLLHE